MSPVDPGFYEVGALIGGVVDPVSVPVAIVCLLAITGALLVLASKELSRSEVSYSSD